MPTDTIRAFATLKGATSESTNEAMLLRVIRMSSAIVDIGASLLSVIATTLAPCSFAYSSSSNVLFEYLGKLIPITRSSLSIFSICSKAIHNSL